MRLAELQIPDASGDPAASCSVVFSSAGGDVAGNLDRWAGQVRDAAGQPSKPAIQTKTVAGLPVTIAEMTGTYTAMGGSPHGNWTVRGAIIETPAGLLFIKMTGPAERIAIVGEAFIVMIDGLKKQ
jgi:hypothetical protein